jgi:hypothetical protein
MTTVLALTVLGILGFFLVYLQWSKDCAVNTLLAEWSAERQAWAKERQELNTRIQHPGVFIRPQVEAQDIEVPSQEPDEIDRVGEIVGASDGD